MIWDFYDGPKTGLAIYKDNPNYFECLFNVKHDEYHETFVLSPVDEAFLRVATTQWKIYREWEFNFHTGLVKLDTHPGHGNVNSEYDQLENELKKLTGQLIQIQNEFIPEFREVPNQDELPNGVLRELEATWREVHL